MGNKNKEEIVYRIKKESFELKEKRYEFKEKINYRNQYLKGYHKDFWTKSKLGPRKANGMRESSLSELGPQSRSEYAQPDHCSSPAGGEP